MKGSKIKLITSGLSFIFTLIFFLGATYAWFIQSKNTYASFIDINVDSLEEIKVSITVHDCVEYDLDGVYYFDKAISPTNKLKTYSVLKQTYRQLLIHVHFIDPVEVPNISLIASTQTDYFLGDGNHPLVGSPTGEGDEYDNAFSSIIAFYIVEAEDATYESYDVYKVNSLGTPYSFIDTTDYSISPYLTLVDKQTVSDIYMVIDYNLDLVFKVFSENLTNPAFTQLSGGLDASVTYVWDILLELKQFA
jgi:hypothetical protein